MFVYCKIKHNVFSLFRLLPALPKVTLPFIFIGVYLASTALWACETPIRYFQSDNRYAYRIELLNLILEKTKDKYGSYCLSAIKENVTQKRGLLLLEQGASVNIASLPTNEDIEQRFLPIKIPILNGILGFRLLLIKKERQHLFKDVQNLDQLSSNFVAGFNSHWTDINILYANNIKVVSTPLYKSLFTMLARDRFDYFPRGLNEIHSESALYPELTIDQYLALHYPYPVYFFVNKSNTALAKRISSGLKLAKQDGSFKALFEHYHQQLIEQANLNSRIIIELKNPYLPANTQQP